MKFLKPSWNYIEKSCKKLSKDIDENYKPDVLIGIIRGGLVPLRLFSDYLENNNVATFRIEYYSGVGKTKEKPEITQPLTVNIKGKKILLIDDVSDSGESLIVAKKYLKNLGAKQIKIVTIHYKLGSKLKPDYFYKTIKKEEWIIYPWEVEETRKELSTST